MRRAFLALLCAAMVGTCGCTVNGVPVDDAQEDVAQESVDEQTLELNGIDDGEDADETLSSLETQVNPSGKTEAGCLMVGLPYTVGPVEFNCPSSFVVMETTDNHIQLYDPEIGLVSLEVKREIDSYPSPDRAELAEQTLIEGMEESYPNGFELRWCEYTPEYIMASYVGDYVKEDHTNKVVGTYMYASDLYTASLTVIVPEDRYADVEMTAFDIADTLRIAQ